MTEYKVRGKHNETLSATYEGGIPGHILVAVYDNYDGANGFISVEAAREFAAALNKLADEADGAA